MFLRNYLLILCLAYSSLVFSQRETYRVFPTCFADSVDMYGVRQVGEDLYVLSASYNDDKSMLLDEYTYKPYTDLYRVDSCNLKLASLKSSLLGKEALLSSPKYDGAISADKDVSIIFFSNNNEKIIGDKMGIYYLNKSNDGWSESTPFPVNSDKYNVMHPHYDEANRRVYFASDIKGGKGGFDVYYIDFDGVDFGKITPLDSINTAANETFPHYINGRVYFTSDGHQSVGGLDVFFEQAGEIIHLPEPINTVYDDFDLYFLDQSTGFLSTNRTDQGKTDQALYFIRSKEETTNALYVFEQQQLIQDQAINLQVITEALDVLITENKKNGLLKTLKFTSTDLQQIQDSINDALVIAKTNNLKRLMFISKQLEELILADEDLNYIEKSTRINQLSTITNKINASQHAEQKEKLTEQLSREVIAKLSKRPSALLNEVKDYKNGLAQLAKMEQQSIQNSIDISQLAELVKQESVKSSIKNPAMDHLMAINNKVDGKENVESDLSFNSPKVEDLDNAKQNREELNTYRKKQATLIANYKNQSIADIINDTLKSEKEKQQQITKLIEALAQADWTKNDSELGSVAASIEELNKKLGFNLSKAAQNELNAIVVLAANERQLIEKNQVSKNTQYNELQQKEKQLKQSFAALELDLLTQLSNNGQLNQENAKKVTQLVAVLANKMEQIHSNQSSIQELKALNSELKQIDSSLTISEDALNDFLMSQQAVIEGKQQQELEEQYAYAQAATQQLVKSNMANSVVGVVQANNTAYGNQKFWVKSPAGVIVDSIITDENGVFVYLSANEEDLEIVVANEDRDQVTFYDGRTKSLSPIQLQSNNGIIPLALFETAPIAILAKATRNNTTDQNKFLLSSSIMKSLIDNYPLPLIQFRFDSYQVQRKYFEQLDELVNVLGEYDQIAVKVVGYTDTSGHPVYNQLLSENRSKAVKRYLVSKGMQEASFVVEGYGAQSPISSNDTKEGRKLNRRVEIQLEIKD